MDTYSEIVFILDRSGSMESMRAEAIGGFNAFLEEQKQVPGRATLTLVLFDHDYDVVHAGVPLNDVAPLDESTFVPRGTTAMLDAIGRTIDDVGKRLAQTPEAQRPDKVIVAILTDGLENASKDYSRQRVSQMIGHQQSVYSWEFFFLGANMDAVSVAQSMNIPTRNAQTYVADAAGMKAAAATYSSFVTRSRTGQRGDEA